MRLVLCGRRWRRFATLPWPDAAPWCLLITPPQPTIIIIIINIIVKRYRSRSRWEESNLEHDEQSFATNPHYNVKTDSFWSWLISPLSFPLELNPRGSFFAMTTICHKSMDQNLGTYLSFLILGLQSSTLYFFLFMKPTFKLLRSVSRDLLHDIEYHNTIW